MGAIKKEKRKKSYLSQILKRKYVSYHKNTFQFYP